jgi:hypothetical protein
MGKRPTCDTPGCGKKIPKGGEGHPEICPDCLKRLAAEDKEAARWQDRIAETIRRAGLEPCDASGNESGDPLDWTDTQVGAALTQLVEVLNAARDVYRSALQTYGRATMGQWAKLGDALDSVRLSVPAEGLVQAEEE